MAPSSTAAYITALAGARYLVREVCGRFAWDWYRGDSATVPDVVGHLLDLADRPLSKGGDVDGAYGALVRDVAAAIMDGLRGPDVGDRVLATMSGAYRDWRESARLRLATHREPWLDSPERLVAHIRSRWRAGSGYPDNKARICFEPTHGSAGLSPDDPRAWARSGGLDRDVTARSARQRATARRDINRREYRPKRRESVSVGGYMSGATYCARPYGKKR